MKTLLLSAWLCAVASVAVSDGGYGYGHPPPAYHCRDANNTIYAEVCVPGVAGPTKPVELKIKKVADDRACFKLTKTTCEESVKQVEKEVCTTVYAKKEEKLPATITQLTYETKSESMKVTTCRPAPQPQYGYGHDSYGKGEHQYCSMEYQTQQYQVPKVDVPSQIEVTVAAPQPADECKKFTIEVIEVTCKDEEVEKCVDFAKLEDSTVTSEQSEVGLGQPDCKQLALALPIQLCSKSTYGYGPY